MTLEALNALDSSAAERAFLSCCGSKRWAREMAMRRPFHEVGEVAAAADRIWSGLEPADWLEAFAAHPRIGESATPKEGEEAVAHGSAWSSEEQRGLSTATDDVRTRLASANRAYEARFGFIYIVCATGKSATAMLEIAERRLTNSPEKELRFAAEEQRQITRLRLDKLLS
jgi:OHCU decarboxylase